MSDQFVPDSALKAAIPDEPLIDCAKRFFEYLVFWKHIGGEHLWAAIVKQGEIEAGEDFRAARQFTLSKQMAFGTKPGKNVFVNCEVTIKAVLHPMIEGIEEKNNG